MKRVTRTSAAATLLMGVAIAVATLATPRFARKVYADDLAGVRRSVEKAKNASWMVTFFVRLGTEDRSKARWFKRANFDLRSFYKAPGLYRDESVRDDGKVSFVTIDDLVRRRRLS